MKWLLRYIGNCPRCGEWNDTAGRGGSPNVCWKCGWKF